MEEFSGLVDWQTGQGASRNEGPGGVAHGFNFQRRNNLVDFTIRVRDTSRHLAAIQDLVDNQTPVSILAEAVRSLDSYAVGQEIGLGCERGVIQPGSRSRGSGETDDVSFPVLGIGPIRITKSE